MADGVEKSRGQLQALTRRGDATPVASDTVHFSRLEWQIVHYPCYIIIARGNTHTHARIEVTVECFKQRWKIRSSLPAYRTVDLMPRDTRFVRSPTCRRRVRTTRRTPIRRKPNCDRTCQVGVVMPADGRRSRSASHQRRSVTDREGSQASPTSVRMPRLMRCRPDDKTELMTNQSRRDGPRIHGPNSVLNARCISRKHAYYSWASDISGPLFRSFRVLFRAQE